MQKQQKRNATSRSAKRRLGMERLEDRSMMATFVWDGDTSSAWNNLQNWQVNGATPAILPTAADSVSINKGTPFTATLDSSRSVGALAGNGSLNLGASANVLSVGSLNLSAVFSGAINGDGGISKTGTGTQTLSGVNTYGGPTTINGGTLQLGSAGISGTLGSGAVTVNSPGNLSISRSDTYILGNSITGTGSVTQKGVGTTILSGNNSYSGKTFIYAGTLQIGNGSNSGTLGSGPVINNGTLVYGRIDSSSWSNSISGTGSLRQNGLPLSALYLDGSNSYSGLTIVAAGYLVARTDTALGSVTAGTIVSTGATLQVERRTVDVHIAAEPLTLSGNGVGGNNGALKNWSGNNSYAGPITLSADSSMFVQYDSLTISGTITGNHGLTKLGGGDLLFAGTISNTYTGKTIVDNGSLYLNKTNAVAIAGPVQMGAENSNQPHLRMQQSNQFKLGVVMTFVNLPGNWAMFDLQGTVQTLSGIQDTLSGGIIQNERQGGGGTTAPAKLRINTTANYSFNGYLRDQNSGANIYPLSLVKLGSGTQTLTSNNNSYTGETTISAGVLQVGDGSMTGSLSSNTAVTISSSAKLLYFRSDIWGDFNIAHSVSGTGTWQFTSLGGVNVGRYQLTGDNSKFSGNLVIDHARVIVFSTNELGAAKLNINTVGQLFCVGSMTYANAVTLNSSGWEEFGWNFGALRLEKSTWTGPFTLTGNSAIGNYSGEFGILSGVISDGGKHFSLTKAGPGTIQLVGTSSNTFTGLTTLQMGMLVLGKTNGAKAIPGDLTIGNGSTSNNLYVRFLANNQFGATSVVSFMNQVGGTSRFELQGTSQSVASINDGFGAAILQNSESGVAGTGVLTVHNNADTTFLGTMRDGNAGKFSLVKSGSGTLQLSGSAIYYSGLTTVSAGTLYLSNTTGFNSSSIVNSNATLRIGNDFTTASTGLTLSSNATIDLRGGTLSYTAANYPFNWLVLNGSVRVSAPSTIQVQPLNSLQTGLFLDGGLTGSAAVTINCPVPGTGVNFRNNNSSFSGKMIVNGVASTNPVVASGIGVGGCTTGLQNANIQLQGTLELLDQGLGWMNKSSGGFTMGALSGNGVIMGNYSVNNGGITTLTLGSNNGSGVFSGVIANGNGNRVNLVKVGTGTQTLSGANSYTGTTSVNVGRLLIDGTLASSVTVSSNATVGGKGTLGSNSLSILSGGVLAPGNGPGILAAGPTTLASGSSFNVELNGDTAGTYDQLKVMGNMNLAGAALNVSMGYTPIGSRSYTIIDNEGSDSIVGTFQGLTEGASLIVNGYHFTITYHGGTGNDVVLQLQLP